MTKEITQKSLNNLNISDEQKSQLLDLTIRLSCVEPFNQLRKRAKTMGLKTNIKKKRHKKKGMIYTMKRKPKVCKPLSPKRYWAESIADTKLSPNMDLMFFIKWEGYSHNDNTWQLIDHLEDCHMLFEDYHKLQFKNGFILDYTLDDLDLFHKCLRESVGSDGDIAVLLKLNDKKVRDYDRSIKTVNALKATIEPFCKAFTLVKRQSNGDLWPVKIFIQYMVNKFKIEENFGDLMKFFEFVDRRKEVLKKLKEWEKDINKAILESDFKEQTISVENNIDLDIPPKLNYINKYKIHSDVYISSTKLQKIKCECDDNCQRNRSCVCALKIYRDNKRFKSSNVTYECSYECKCDETCPNRRVQVGRQFKLRGNQKCYLL